MQEKLDELWFVSTPGIWENVEKEITGKKRRRVLGWLPLCCLLLICAGYFYFQRLQAIPAHPINSNAAKTITEIPHHSAQFNRTTVTETKVLSAKITAERSTSARAIQTQSPSQRNPETTLVTPTERPLQQQVIGRQETTTSTQPAPNSTQSPALEKTNTKSFIPADKRRQAGNFSKAATLRQHTTVSTEGNQEKNLLERTAEVPRTNYSISKLVNTSGAIVTTAMPVPDAIAVTDSAQALHNIDSLVVASTKEKPSLRKKNKKLNWGISVGAGLSGRASGFFTSNKNIAMTSPPANNGSTGLTSSNNYILVPSAISPGFSGQAGIVVSKPIGKTIILRAELQYFYHSDRIHAGARNVMMQTIQYANGQSFLFKNNFHFVQLPVLFEKQLGIVPRFSVEGGLAFSLLIGSKALQYNPQTNIYYEDQGNISKTQVAALAGINYRLLPKYCSIEISPRFSYAFSNLFRNEAANNRHLFFTGINANFFFNRKEK